MLAFDIFRGRKKKKTYRDSAKFVLVLDDKRQFYVGFPANLERRGPEDILFAFNIRCNFVACQTSLYIVQIPL